MNQDSQVSYANQNAPKPSLNNRDEQVNFLEKMRSLVNTVKALVGSQQTSTAPPPIAFAGLFAKLSSSSHIRCAQSFHNSRSLLWCEEEIQAKATPK